MKAKDNQQGEPTKKHHQETKDGQLTQDAKGDRIYCDDTGNRIFVVGEDMRKVLDYFGTARVERIQLEMVMPKASMEGEDRNGIIEYKTRFE